MRSVSNTQGVPMFFKAPNYTQTPNEFFDEIAKTLKEGELRVLLVIMRQTFGWGNKEWDRISITQLMKKTGMERMAVIRSAASLAKKKIILKHKTGEKGKEETWYSLSVKNDEELQKPPDDSNNFDQYPKDTPPSIFRIPTKETLTKENKESPTVSPPLLSRVNGAQEARPPSPPITEIPKEAEEMAQKLLSKVKAIHPKLKKPNLAKWAKDMDLLHRRDNRSWSEIDQMIDWAFEDSFWVKVIQSPEGLRNNWDKMAVQMAKVDNKSITMRRNRMIANEMKEFLRQVNKDKLLWVGNDFVRNTQTGDSIFLDLPSETFEGILCKWFGLRQQS